MARNQTDIQTFFIGFDAGCDYQADALGLAVGDDLSTAIIVSLFSDRRAEPGDDVVGDPRGWWGDAVALDGAPAAPLGSRLWLLRREKMTAQTLRRAEQYASEALRWLIDDGIAASVVCRASAPRIGLLRLDVDIDGQPFQFEVT